MSATLSPDERMRYTLGREIAPTGPRYLFVGVNPSTADAAKDDHTVRKWSGFVRKWGGSGFDVINVFPLRSTDVSALGEWARSGPDFLSTMLENAKYSQSLIARADIIVPCWGALGKIPPNLHIHMSNKADSLRASGRPVMCFGYTGCRQPRHPLTLSYSTQLEIFK